MVRKSPTQSYETILHNGNPKFKVGDIIQHLSGQVREVIIVNHDSYIVKDNHCSLYAANEDDFTLLK